MTKPQDVPQGRREATKRATRRALQDAASRLFDERGYAHTTVRDIAAAAGVTERTFFRYFGSKEELLAERVLATLPVLVAAITERPHEEAPLVAVQNAFAHIVGAMDARPGTARDFFAQGPPAVRMRGAAPSVLLAFEAGIAQALKPRLTKTDPARAEHEMDYRCEVLAAAAMSVVRSALIRDSRRGEDDLEDPRHLAELVTDGFSFLAE